MREGSLDLTEVKHLCVALRSFSRKHVDLSFRDFA